jgi:hypothetical protein
MQHGKKKAAGVVGGEISGRLNANHDQPQNCGDPGFEDLVAIGAQVSAEPIVTKFPPFDKLRAGFLAKDARNGAPTVIPTFSLY